MMADDKPSVSEVIGEYSRRIATPVAQHSVFIISLAVLGCYISGAEKISLWKGCLLSAVLAIFSGIAAASIWMAINKPRHLTFDKEAHKEIDVNAATGATVFD